jgi:hypothetical protein
MQLHKKSLSSEFEGNYEQKLSIFAKEEFDSVRNSIAFRFDIAAVLVGPAVEAEFPIEKPDFARLDIYINTLQLLSHVVGDGLQLC